MSNYIDLDVSIAEAKSFLELQYKTGGIHRELAKAVLGSTSLIVSVIAAIQTIRGAPVANVNFYNLVVVASALVFFVLIFCCIWLLLPFDFYTPVKSSPEEYESAFRGKDEEDVLLMQLSGTLNAIRLNRPLIFRRTKMIWAAGASMVLAVGGMMGLLLIK